jgi:hypothetical protein
VYSIPTVQPRSLRIPSRTGLDSKENSKIGRKKCLEILVSLETFHCLIQITDIIQSVPSAEQGSSSLAIAYAGDGSPRLPLIDLKSHTPANITSLLEAFLTAAWGMYSCLTLWLTVNINLDLSQRAHSLQMWSLPFRGKTSTLFAQLLLTRGVFRSIKRPSLPLKCNYTSFMHCILT